MCLRRPIDWTDWYHFPADPIWPIGPFKGCTMHNCTYVILETKCSIIHKWQLGAESKSRLFS